MSSDSRRSDESGRIVVSRTASGYSIDYKGTDPDTRYEPRARTLGEKIRDRFAIGIGGSPERIRSLGR